LHVGSVVRQQRILSLSLLAALAMTACTSATLPKLTDLTGGDTQPKAEGAPGPSDVALPGPMPPAAGVAGPSSVAPQAATVGDPVRPTSERAMIVGFKTQTVVLFAEEHGNDGERVATSSLVLPLQMRNAASNAGRVQIETAYGPRWIARSEIVLGAADRQGSSRPLR